MAIDSTELAQVIAEAEDIAKSVGHQITTAHLLLAAFTVPNRAQVLLRERGVDEDLLLSLMTKIPQEPENMAGELLDRAREIAKGCSLSEVDSGHLLIAITRTRDCLAVDLLRRSGINLSALRNTALSYYLGGHMPRRLMNLERCPPQTSSSGKNTRSFLGGRLWGTPAPTVAPAHLTKPVAERKPLPKFSPKPLPKPLPKIESRIEPLEPPTKPVTPRDYEPGVGKTSSSLSSKYQLSEKEYPWLTSLGRNLTALAAEQQIDPVIGRAREIEEIIDILGKRRTNNPCLLGEPGVGKTAVVEGVACKLWELSQQGVSERLVIELDMASVVAGTHLRGSFSEKLNGIKDEVRRAGGRVIIFIDEIHTLIGAGSTGEGPQDAANELKSVLARGDFPCIGATTHDEYRKFIQQDPALERRFTAVSIREPSISETEQILAGIIGRYEEHHGVTYQGQALQAAAALASKYVSDRFLPDKAISIVDLAGSRSRREGVAEVGVREIARIVSRLAGVPEERLLLSDSDRLLRLEKDLAKRVLGHLEAIRKVAGVVRRNYAGFSSRRPMGSFMFLGPTGVGKTELARVLAEVLFGGPEALVRVDMSECSEAHGVARLLGAPPGYVGYGEPGQLTEPVRKRPSCVVLLDEIEKAHREVAMILLQILEEGRLTDGKGRHIDFSNTVVILTTNLGSEAFQKGGGQLGFGAASAAPGQAHLRALDLARCQMPAELWNRLDERLVFEPLQKEDVSKIARLILGDSSRRLQNEKGISYQVSPEVVEYLLTNGGFDFALGARPMRQAVQRVIEAPLAEEILQRRFQAGDEVLVRMNGEAVVMEKVLEKVLEKRGNK